jgi:hypothetical protein
MSWEIDNLSVGLWLRKILIAPAPWVVLPALDEDLVVAVWVCADTVWVLDLCLERGQAMMGERVLGQ